MAPGQLKRKRRRMLARTAFNETYPAGIPENCGEDHLKLLSQVAELFSDPSLLRELREAKSNGRLLKLLSSTHH